MMTTETAIMTSVDPDGRSVDHCAETDSPIAATGVRPLRPGVAAGSLERFRLVWGLLLLTALFLFAASCSGGDAASEDAVSGETSSILAVAEQNQGDLALTDDLASTELLDGNSGAIATLSDVVTGDRALLVWYWAPN